jgi:CheY-specific phosphatase CheX
MFSQPSRRKVPLPSEHVEALRKALVDVAQESFFSFAEYCGKDRFDEALPMVDTQDVAGPRWVSARIDFDGAFAGRVTVIVPHVLACDMAAAIGGLMPGDEIPEPLVADSTGEFANMVCGTWLTRSCARRRFDLQPPVVTSSESLPTSGDDDEELLLVNDWPVKLAVAFEVV